MSVTFQSSRLEEFPSMFGDNRTSVNVDLVEVGIIFVFTVLAAVSFVIVLGYGKKKSLCTFSRIGLSIFIGGSLMISNFGQEWEVAHINSKTPYRAGDRSEIDAKIGVRIGLRSVNITLKAEPDKEGHFVGETIDYNERFSWEWDQGRLGFGPNAGHLQRTFREAQRRGLPIPIIWIVDYFIVDGEALRFGRYYRTAGWYCHILLWAALPAWILANIFLQSVARYAAYFTGLVGFLELTSCFVWIFVRNPIPLVIPFEDATLEMSLGSSFWLACFTGILCLFLATVLIIMDLRYPNSLSAFLGTSILDQYDECVVRAVELDYIRDKSNKHSSIELGKMSGHFAEKDSGVVLLKRRSTAKRAQKDLLRVGQVTMKIPHYDDVYYSTPRPGPSKEELEEVIAKPRIPRRKQSKVTAEV